MFPGLERAYKYRPIDAVAKAPMQFTHSRFGAARIDHRSAPAIDEVVGHDGTDPAQLGEQFRLVGADVIAPLGDGRCQPANNQAVVVGGDD